jgi:hypothetical protein
MDRPSLTVTVTLDGAGPDGAAVVARTTRGASVTVVDETAAQAATRWWFGHPR